MSKFTLTPFFVLISFAVFGQRTSNANWNYTDQSDLDNFSSEEYVTGNRFESINIGPLSLGVTIGRSENSNIIFHDNIVKALGINFGMFVSDSSHLSIKDNTFQNESTFRAPFHFVSDDSEIINNTFINDNEEALIEGNNNIISN